VGRYGAQGEPGVREGEWGRGLGPRGWWMGARVSRGGEEARGASVCACPCVPERPPLPCRQVGLLVGLLTSRVSEADTETTVSPPAC